MESHAVSDHLINDVIGEEKRKLETDLSLYGYGIIIFSAWSFIKLVIEIFLDDYVNLVEYEYLSSTININLVIKTILLCIITPIFLVDFFVRYRVGSAAIKVSNNSLSLKKQKENIRWAIFLAIYNFILIILSLLDIETEITTAFSFTLDILSEYITIRLILISKRLYLLNHHKECDTCN